MLQLNSNITSNTIAVIPDITGSHTGSIYLGFTNQLTNQVTYSTSSVVTNNNYLIVELTGSQVPTASGQYLVDFITGSTQIAQARAYVSGTNEVPLIQYLNPTQIEVYNG